MTPKPDSATAMRELIAEARAALPFAAPDARACTGRCEACAAKLLETLDIELDGWERRLAAGARPTFRDLSDLAQTCRQVRAALAADEVTEPSESGANANPLDQATIR